MRLGHIIALCFWVRCFTLMVPEPSTQEYTWVQPSCQETLTKGWGWLASCEKGGINCGWRGVARIFQSRGHTVLNREYSPHYQVNLHTVFYLIWHKKFTKGGHFRTPPPLALDLTWHYLYFCEGTRSNLEITRSILVWYWTILKVLFYYNRLVKLKAMK